MKKWYESLFVNYAKTYDTEVFTRGTLVEVDFLEQELGRDRKKRVLDVGCGTGRHAIELAKRGYRVTGIDLSRDQLARAREKAREAGVAPRFLRRDARTFRFREKFDAVIMICEGGFSLMETDEENFSILRNCARSLKKGGTFVFTTLNALYPLNHSVKDFLNENQVSGPITALTFDWTTLRERTVLKVKDDDGRTKVLHCNERYYMPSELTWMLRGLGFRDVHISGCMPGSFSRKRKVTPDDFELLVIAK